MIPDFFKIRKRRFLRKYAPPLYIKRRNAIRIPGIYDGEINLHFNRKGRSQGYKDLRDYVTDLAMHGIKKVSIQGPDEQYTTDTDRFIDLKYRYDVRDHVVKIDLKCFDWREIEDICHSVSNIDVYDFVSYMIMIGQIEINGGIKYERGMGHEKLYT